MRPAHGPSHGFDGAERRDMHVAGQNGNPLRIRIVERIGPARAKAIIAGRPYKGKDDLVKKNIIPSNVYQGIKDQIIAKRK